ncbi:Enoyl-[acyl-carrier-protein] reductase (NADH) [Magnetococcus marinus MC-1]|uniref:Enoyl-[acyl-carrier-protein] reductase [NADH] n=1 Tax=Magnetococcus marinus (strain ATCC BAA-1437 / JCM 17883 / MC-1) TaxID=156889 RepID=A0LDR2_MAGMM|nr:SDR family oxidoreductase [Magnetococcus marinus]ABK46105.1 Enoyl-[acyl-carrier-protein] reductase (NADH) [Magnetococcus marinus MC-1]
MGLMKGKRGIIFGVANDRSIAWSIAEVCKREGAEIGITYLGEAMAKRVVPLGEKLGAAFTLSCDATDDAEIQAVIDASAEIWDGIDFIVHSVAYAKKEELKGKFYDTSKEGFQLAMTASVYTLISICRIAEPRLTDGAGILTMSYLGAERVMPHYNVMGVAKAALEASVRYLAVDMGQRGIRVNGISAGPIRTLAAAGISDFKEILNWNRDNAPMRRNISQQEVGESSLLFLSDMGSGVTGEIMHVDAGYHVVGMRAVDE